LRKRRSAAVFAVSLLVHIALFGAWFATHPAGRFVEPATMQIELIRPPPRVRQKQPSKPTPVSPARRGAPVASTPLGRPPAKALNLDPSLLAIAPRVVDPRKMTDQDLLNRAGPRPDLAKTYADESRQPTFSRPLGRNPEDMTLSGCKPPSEHSRRIAPPCPVRKAPGPTVPLPVMGSAKEAAFAAEAQAKKAIGTYKGAYGSTGAASVNDYPSLRCVFAHTHCGPADPTMDPLHPPPR
jgi:hypothetical protein